MTVLSVQRSLNSNEFAFYFHDDGVDANELGRFLQRASTVTRREGLELRVVGIERGSLTVKIKALKKGTKKHQKEYSKNASKELKKSPIVVSAAIITAVAALITALSPDGGDASPIAKSAAAIVEKENNQKIEIVTVVDSVVVMDAKSAMRVRQNERNTAQLLLPHDQALQIAHFAERGSLEGTVFSVGGELHFRPEGYRYVVPIDMRRSEAADFLLADAMFRIRGEILMKAGRPDQVIIHSAQRI